MSKTATSLAFGWARGLMLATGLAAALAAGSAQAAVYTGVWDPAYDASRFPNLGWRGQATFAVPTGCEPSGTGDISNADCGGAAVVTHAQVELYDFSVAGEPVLATLLFDPASMGILSLRYTGGLLTQVNTTASALVDPTEDLSAFGVGASVSFSLQFSFAEGPRLNWFDCPQRLECQSGSNVGQPLLTITRVPEPGTLWLGGLALLALSQVRRGAPARRA